MARMPSITLRPHLRSGIGGMVWRMANARSCIRCTNVAKSGVTIPNVGVVISSGAHRRVSIDVTSGVTVNLSKSQMTQQMGRTGRIDEGERITMMSHSQYVQQVRAQDVAQLDENDLTYDPKISCCWPFLCTHAFSLPSRPAVHLRAKERTFLHEVFDTRQVTLMGGAVAAMDLPCHWVQFLYLCTEKDVEESALILYTHMLNHGHPHGDIMISLMHITGSALPATTIVATPGINRIM